MLESTIKFVIATPLLLALIKILIVFAVVSGIVAYLVYMERKVLAFMQARLGPMRVGPWGLLQPVADGLKLLLKEDIIPAGRGRVAFPAGARHQYFRRLYGFCRHSLRGQFLCDRHQHRPALYPGGFFPWDLRNYFGRLGVQQPLSLVGSATFFRATGEL